MLYNREKIILALLEQLGAPVSLIKIQKFLFLLSDRMADRPYDFIPYKYGCYSFQASQDLKHLATADLVTIAYVGNEKRCGLTTYSREYSKLVDNEVLSHIKKLTILYGSLQSSELIKYTYIQYPFFAINSQILKEYFDADDINTILKYRPHKITRTLFTIGYEGLTLEKYILKLILEDIRVLCDVRKNAYSQKFGFSKALLKTACEGAGIKYIHIPALGINSEKRKGLKSSEEYDRLFKEYEETILMSECDALNCIFKLLQSEERVALTCFEHDPMQCHRLRIANKLLSTPMCNYNLINL